MQIKYNNSIKERFIPISYDEILIACINHFDIKDKQIYAVLSKSIHKYYYDKFYQKLQVLKDNYNPFNLDNDLILPSFSKEEYRLKENTLFANIKQILNHANYELLTQEILQEAMNKTSPYGVEVSVDFDDFEEIQLYYRGESLQREIRRDPKKFYLKKFTHIEPIYRRLFLIIKPKHIDTRAEEIARKNTQDIDKVKKKLLRENPLLSVDSSNKNIYIKLFKNIPQVDLETLFPNSKVRMTVFDKLKLGVLGGGGTIGGGSTLIAKLSIAAIEPISAMLALGAFGGVLWKQVKAVYTRRTHYMAELAKNLYFHNLDNNAGALNYIIDMAEEEESKEVLLTYIFLSQSDVTMTKEELDSAIEIYINKNYEIEMDFEIEDGLKKLQSLGILIDNNGNLTVETISKSLELLKFN